MGAWLVLQRGLCTYLLRFITSDTGYGGIGTNNPTEKLDVVGMIKATALVDPAAAGLLSHTLSSATPG